MIEKLIQDKCGGLEDLSFMLSKDLFAHLRDEVECCASAGSACEEIVKFLVENWYSSAAMVD